MKKDEINEQIDIVIDNMPFELRNSIESKSRELLKQHNCDNCSRKGNCNIENDIREAKKSPDGDDGVRIMTRLIVLKSIKDIHNIHNNNDDNNSHSDLFDNLKYTDHPIESLEDSAGSFYLHETDVDGQLKFRLELIESNMTIAGDYFYSEKDKKSVHIVNSDLIDESIFKMVEYGEKAEKSGWTHSIIMYKDHKDEKSLNEQQERGREQFIGGRNPKAKKTFENVLDGISNRLKNDKSKSDRVLH